VTHKNGMLEMSRINVIFLTNLEKWPIFVNTSLLVLYKEAVRKPRTGANNSFGNWIITDTAKLPVALSTLASLEI